ncbi:DMT family transporter [Acuticoccus kandeliae]|uniref:DMT family transporter n=1 Tax=Acuticoccus kandeliae TaxID=2073160 RepID=UPI00147356CF|nr:DMT family transporter [Acuticoccus kandeliae]
MALILGLIGMVMFAGTLPATRMSLDGFSPTLIAVGRAFVGGILSIVLLAVTRQPIPAWRDVPTIALIAACVIIGFPLFTGLAMVHVPASHGSVVLAILPLATAVAAALVGGERPGRSFWMLSVLGGAIVLYFSLSDAGWALQWGDAFLLVGSAVAALGYALAGRLSRRVPGWTIISWALILMLPITTVATFLSLPETLPTSGVVWGAFLYLGVFSMFLGFLFWNWAMSLGGIAKIGQLQLIQPFLTILIAAVIGGEALEPHLILFATLVVAVVGAAQRVKVARGRG